MDTKTRKIARYQNRKLYDFAESRYVTLEEITQFIKDGWDIMITDKKTGECCTFLMLLSALFEEEKRSTKLDDTLMLKRVIGSFDGTFTGYIKEMEHEVGFFTNKKMADKIDRTPSELN